MGFVDTHRDLRNPTNGRKKERMNEQVQAISGPDRHFMERAMGIEQIRMNQTKALPPVPQSNWSQMESTYAKSYDTPVVGVKIGKLGWCGSMLRVRRKIPLETHVTKTGTRYTRLGLAEHEQGSTHRID
jgi:hypothetical protein